MPHPDRLQPAASPNAAAGSIKTDLIAAPAPHLATPVEVRSDAAGATRAEATVVHLAESALRYAADLANAEAKPSLQVNALPRPARPTPEQLRSLPVAVVRQHLDRLLMGKRSPQGLDALQELGVLDVWLPEVAALVGFGDFQWRHKDVWKHSKQVVWQSVPRLAVRWAALLHDIGKVKTRTIAADGQVHFLGHAEVGAAMFRKRIAPRLGFEDALMQRVDYLIYQHLRGSQYDGSWTDNAVRRFYREMGEGLVDLLCLSRADITTKRVDKRRRALRHISELGARVRALQVQDSQTAPLPKGIGNLLATAFNIPPSKKLGDLRRYLEEAINAGRIEPQQSAEHYVEWLRAHLHEFNL